MEVRDRVKCISGIEGVPVSTQWEPKGFFYPTQIAQFGLAHYSKNITEPPPRIKVIDDGEKVLENWIVSKDAVMTREFDTKLKAKVIRFSTTNQTSSQVWVKVNITQDFVLSLDLLLKPNSSLTVVLQNKDKKETVYLHYVTSNQLIYTQVVFILSLVATLCDIPPVLFPTRYFYIICKQEDFCLDEYVNEALLSIWRNINAARTN